MTELSVRTDGLTRDFGAVRAVDHLSLEVPAGLIFGFLGPNGSGKTTTIRLLLGLLEPTAGRAEVLGFDTQSHPDEIRTRTGALLEHPGLYDRLTAEQNLDFYGEIWHLSRQERDDRIRELLTHVGLWERRGERVNTWSTGMRQKLVIARALLHRPALVFLDEPTAGLDAVAANTMRADLAGLAATEGVTIFLTTHNLHEAEQLCQLVAVIREGRLVATGTPDELRARSSGPRIEISGRGFRQPVLEQIEARTEVECVRVDNDGMVVHLRHESPSHAIVRDLVLAGAEIDEVHRGGTSLEETFIDLIQDQEQPA